MSIIPVITSTSVASGGKLNGTVVKSSLQNGSCISHSNSLPMIAHDLSDESSLHDVTPMRESALGSSKATSLDAIGSEVSIHLPNSGSLAFTATTCLQKNSMSNQFTKKRIVQRKSSNSSVHSETRTNLILQNVGRTIQRTHNHLRRTRLLHAFYFFALPIYTVVGALIFQALDGEHDDSMKREYDRRCQYSRTARLDALKSGCMLNPNECFDKMSDYLEEVESCYRAWHEVNRTMTHPMSDFTNALVYAFSVYTTIGYGNMAADTMGCRVATVIYGALGIPLFFAFIKEEGNLFRLCFIWIYKYIQKIRVRSCRWLTNVRRGVRGPLRRDAANLTDTVAVLVERTQDLATRNPNAPFIRNLSNGSLFGSKGRHTSVSEQRRVFIAGVAVFIVYLLAVSGVFAIMTDWDYFTAFYFLFNSVALIGFGDIFPAEPKIILVNTFFIVMGVVLFSMCYFILQEEIREKAFEASRRARMSISKYSHTLMQHTKNPWSRRNSPAFDSSGSPEPNAFEKLRKRRQSAPAVSLTVPPFTISPRGKISK